MMKSMFKSLTFASLFALTSACEISNEGFDISAANDQCEASGALCTDPTGAGLLALSISNSSPYSVKNPNNRRFDIAGLCNEADYSENYIEYMVTEPGSGNNIVPITKVFNICNRGRYRIQVNLPLTANPNIINRLRLELVGLTLTGEESRNPLAAQREIDLISL